jgi:hypothetical protein
VSAYGVLDGNGIGTPCRYDVRHDGLAGRRVLDPDHRGLRDAVDLADDLLDLDRVDVDAGDDDPLLETVDEAQE